MDLSLRSSPLLAAEGYTRSYCSELIKGISQLSYDDILFNFAYINPTITDVFKLPLLWRDIFKFKYPEVWKNLSQFNAVFDYNQVMERLSNGDSWILISQKGNLVYNEFIHEQPHYLIGMVYAAHSFQGVNDLFMMVVDPYGNFILPNIPNIPNSRETMTDLFSQYILEELGESDIGSPPIMTIVDTITQNQTKQLLLTTNPDFIKGYRKILDIVYGPNNYQVASITSQQSGFTDIRYMP